MKTWIRVALAVTAVLGGCASDDADEPERSVSDTTTTEAQTTESSPSSTAELPPATTTADDPTGSTTAPSPDPTATFDAALAEATIDSVEGRYPEAVAAGGRDLFLATLTSACTRATEGLAAERPDEEVAVAIAVGLPAEDGSELWAALLTALHRFFLVDGCGPDVSAIAGEFVTIRNAEG